MSTKGTSKNKTASKKNTPPPAEFTMKPWHWVLGVSLVTLLVFRTAASYSLLNFDDDMYFNSYPEIVNLSAASIVKYFQNYYLLMYQPLPVLSMAAIYDLAGLDPAPQHWINILVHILNIWLVFSITSLLSPSRFVRVAVPLFFALHPMQVEPVVWISSRSSGFFMAFYLLGIWQYLLYAKAEKKRALHFALAMLFNVLALFSKVHAVTFVLSLGVLDWYLQRPLGKKIVLEKIPFLALSIAFGLLALSNQETTQNIATGWAKYNIFDGGVLALYSIAFYFYKLLLPLGLSPIYVTPLKTGGLLPWYTYVSVVVLPILAFFAIKQYRQRPYLLFGLLFFLTGISVTLQIIPSRLFLMADRYVYMPFVGIFFALACFIDEKRPWLSKKTGLEIGPELILSLWFVFMAFVSYRQIQIWQTDLTLADRIIEANSEAPYLSRAYGIRANYYRNVVRTPQKALDDYSKAIQMDSSMAINWINRSSLKLDVNDADGALADLNYVNAIDSSAMVYHFKGFAYYKKQQYQLCINNCKKSLEINPDTDITQNLLGACYNLNGQNEAAIEHFNKALALNPKFGEAHKNKATVLAQINGNRDTVCHHLRMAIKYGYGLQKDLEALCQ